jgi:hypothetical protein
MIKKMMEIQGLENRIPVRKIYLDTKQEVNYRSICDASRRTGVSHETIKNSLNPIKRKRFVEEDREFIFRILKQTT